MNDQYVYYVGDWDAPGDILHIVGNQGKTLCGKKIGKETNGWSKRIPRHVPTCDLCQTYAQIPVIQGSKA